ncbi:MAG: helix-turn-helix domain-containing protein [Acidobacteriota bacterium]
MVLTPTRPRMKDVLEDVVDEMVVGGILWPEARSQFEKLFIIRVLRETGGNLGLAAEKMGVHRNTLSKKVREYRIERKQQLTGPL